MKADFLRVMQSLAAMVYDEAKAKGYWDDLPATSDDKGWNARDCKALAFMHAELSEALEGLAMGNGPSDHIPSFSCAEEELADVILRVIGYCHGRGWRVAEAMLAKMEFNYTRPRLHGKRFGG